MERESQLSDVLQDEAFVTQPEEIQLSYKLAADAIKERQGPVDVSLVRARKELQKVTQELSRKQDEYHQLCIEFEHRENAIVERQNQLETTMKQHERKIRKAAEKRENAQRNFKQLLQYAEQEKAECQRLREAIEHHTVLLELLGDSLGRWEVYRTFVKDAVSQSDEIFSTSELISRYESLEEQLEHLRAQIAEKTEAKARLIGLEEEQQLKHQREAAAQRELISTYTGELHSLATMQQDAQIHEAVVQEKYTETVSKAGAIHSAIGNLFESMKAPRHYLERSMTLEPPKLLDGALLPIDIETGCHVPVSEFDEASIPPKIMEAARRLHFIAMTLQTMEIVCSKAEAMMKKESAGD